MAEMNMRYGAGDASPGVGKLYKAEVRSVGEWSHLGHYESVQAFEKLYDHLHATEWNPLEDTYQYFEEETGFSYRLLPILFLKER